MKLFGNPFFLNLFINPLSAEEWLVLDLKETEWNTKKHIGTLPRVQDYIKIANFHVKYT